MRHGDHDVDLLEAEDAAALAGVAADHAVLRERRMQVDDVRHDGRAENAGGQENALGAVEARLEEALQDGAAVGVRVEHLKREAGHDDPDEGRDDGFEVAHAAQLGGQDRERDDAREHARGQERQAEEQVEAERCADELGQVGGHGDRLGLEPQEDRASDSRRSTR